MAAGWAMNLAGGTDRAQEVALFQVVTDFDNHFFQMSVAGLEAAFMLEENKKAITTIPTRETRTIIRVGNDLARGGGKNRRATVIGNINGV